MQWFRLYTEMLHDPKVQLLDPPLFKIWANLLCVAAEHEGVLPDDDACAFALRMTKDAFQVAFQSLKDAGLFDVTKSKRTPHGWQKRQYKSDTSTERVKRFRQQKKSVTVTPPETDTDTETDISKDIPPKGSKPPAENGLGGDSSQLGSTNRPDGRQPVPQSTASPPPDKPRKLAQATELDAEFERLWLSYRPFEMDKGPKQIAKKSFIKARKETENAAIISGCENYLKFCHNSRIKTKHLATWLNQRGWEGEYPDAAHGHSTSARGPDCGSSYGDKLLRAAAAADAHLGANLR